MTPRQGLLFGVVVLAVAVLLWTSARPAPDRFTPYHAGPPSDIDLLSNYCGKKLYDAEALGIYRPSVSPYYRYPVRRSAVGVLF